MVKKSHGKNGASRGMLFPSTPPLERRRRKLVESKVDDAWQQPSDELYHSPGISSPHAYSYAHPLANPYAMTPYAYGSPAAHSPAPPIALPALALPAASFTQATALTVDGARRAMTAAIHEAKRNRWNVTIVVVDHSGLPLLLERLNGAAPVTVDIAMGKARTAALSGRDSGVFEHSVNGGAIAGSGWRRPRLALLSVPQLTLMEGALPITVNGICVGAVGVSGVRGDQDTQVARVGVAALSGEVTAASAASHAVAALAASGQQASAAYF